MKADILIVDDERLIRTSLARAVARMGHEAVVAGSLDEAQRAISGTRFDAVVLDLKLGSESGLTLLRDLREQYPTTKVVMITAHGSVETAVEAMKLGAFDFVKKPFELDELLATLDHALRAASLERRVAYHERRERSRAEQEPAVSLSAAAKRLDGDLATLATQPVGVLLLDGESGSGKATMARRIHFMSPRAKGPFVELDATSVDESILEAELFGVEKGSVPGASDARPGLVEIAHGGTLYLGEVGVLGAAAQAGLIALVEAMSFRRVGSTARHEVDVRVIVSTHQDLGALVRAGSFRSDLFYALEAFRVRIPSLRERREDIGPLAQHFLVEFALRYQKKFARVSSDAGAMLERWAWPGNVRELRAVIQRAALMNDAVELGVAHLPAELIGAALDPIPAALASRAQGLPTLEEMEIQYMRAVLELCGNNKVRAAERLGITRQTLARRLGEVD
jgi:DNA-binding NtrC family response regulator